MPNEPSLEALEKLMFGMNSGFGVIDVGYTYFGQFIAHDIAPATNPPPGISRVASPFLDLDSLYGGHNQTGAVLDAQGLFDIRPSLPDGPDDLPRDKDGRALIPDHRNDENVIIAQLHLFWQRFHNVVMRQGWARDAEHARYLLTKVFQLLVVEDYLRQVLAPAVFDSYFRYGRHWLSFDQPVPPEFSRAAFRFGHSMARGFYVLSPAHERNLTDLFRPNEKLTSELHIDWSLFFGWPRASGGAQQAAKIDPFINPAMKKIRVVRGSQTLEFSIVRLNLEAAQAAALPTGKVCVERILGSPNGNDIRASFGLAPLKDLKGFVQPGSDITVNNLPLWPYILVEALQAGGTNETGTIGTLGTLGSLICAEVLATAIEGARYSIRRESGRWRCTDEVLCSLGPLGAEINAVRRQHANSGITTRTFCMRHVIELVRQFSTK